MKSFFSSENWFWKGFGRIADYFIISTMWMVCSVPLITAGTASIALYDTVAHCIRGGELDIARRFFGTFKKELGRGILLTLLWGAVTAVLNVGYQIVTQMGQGTLWQVFGIAYYITLLLPLGIICWLLAIESRFSHKFGELHRTALMVTISHLPQTLAIVAIFVAALNVCRNFPFFLMFVPAIMAHIQSIFIEKVFQKYTPEEPEV